VTDEKSIEDKGRCERGRAKKLPNPVVPYRLEARRYLTARAAGSQPRKHAALDPTVVDLTE
jgi:hypothetical protein